MVDINCIICKEPIKIPSYMNSKNHDGQLFCDNCNLLLDIIFKSSSVVKYKVAEKQPKVKPNVKIITGVPRPANSKEAKK